MRPGQLARKADTIDNDCTPFYASMRPGSADPEREAADGEEKFSGLASMRPGSADPGNALLPGCRGGRVARLQ